MAQTSWTEVEEMIQMDVAIWKSSAAAVLRPKEYRDLMEGASVKFMDRGVAIISVGKLEWKLTPTSTSVYCNWKFQVPEYSLFRVALRPPHGRRGELEVFPCSDVIMSSDKLGVDDKLKEMLTRLFSSEETSAMLRRITVTQVKHAERDIAEALGPPFVRCVKDLQNATCVSEVLDTVLGFSAAFVSTQQALQQGAGDQAESDVDDHGCFYDKEVMEEERMFLATRRSGSLWIRQQVRDAAMECQVAADAVLEVAKLGAEMLAKALIRGKYTYLENVTSETSESIEHLNPNCSSSSRLYLGNYRMSHADPGQSSLDNYLENETSGMTDMEHISNNDPLRAFLPTPSYISSWECELRDDTYSESSWDESVQAQSPNGATHDDADSEDEDDDILGAGILDAESLDMMLRGRDPCGSSGCSHLIDRYLSLDLSSSDQYHERNAGGLETPRSCVLKRLASWSSSNSGWSDRDIVPASAAPPSAIKRRFRKMQLKALAEEPACDSEIARLCQSFVRRAAAKGDVLQWCSCKFNKSRSVVELRFQVGSFMEDDIATLSTGINWSSDPLRIEIFLDPSSIIQSLVAGDVRISVEQSSNTPGPVVGLSCYIPHLVRQYLKQLHHTHEAQSMSTSEFDPEGAGQLFTGLMKHVVAKLVFMKTSCCVCGRDRPDSMITSFVPRPCDQNLCQALHEAWLVVAPQMVLEQFTVELWLRRFSNLSTLVGIREMVHGSWLRLINYSAMKPDEELDFRARLLAIPAIKCHRGQALACSQEFN